MIERGVYGNVGDPVATAA